MFFIPAWIDTMSTFLDSFHEFARQLIWMVTLLPMHFSWTCPTNVAITNAIRFLLQPTGRYSQLIFQLQASVLFNYMYICASLEVWIHIAHSFSNFPTHIPTIFQPWWVYFFYQNSTLQFSVIFFVRCWKTNVQCARFSIFVDLNHVEHRDET